MAFRCPRCHASFPSSQALGGHRSHGRICPEINRSTNVTNSLSASSNSSSSIDSTNSLSMTSLSGSDSDESVPQPAAQVLPTPAPAAQVLQPAAPAAQVLLPNAAPVTITQLLQRPPKGVATHRIAPSALRPGSRTQHVVDSVNTYKLHETQEAYDEYCEAIRQKYSDDFWRIFSSVYTCRNVVIDRVLKECRDVFVADSDQRQRFDPSVRLLRENIERVAGDFKSHIMHEITIDVRRFGVAGLHDVKFRFVNPLWAWVQAANAMASAGHTINFDPKEMYHETTNERLFGAGVSYGDKLALAASCTPHGGKPALFGISFDGGESGVGSRSLYPMCVSVLNFDGADPLACGLVGYLPALAVSKAVLKTKRFKLLRGHVLQRCVGVVLDEFEHVFQDGFTAIIGGNKLRLHPFLAAVRVDSKERKKYFGLKSDRTCAICRFRKGWSSLRQGTFHGKTQIRRLWNLAIDTRTTRRRTAFGRAQKRAREQLIRHGFNKRQRCHLLDHASRILIRDPRVMREPLFNNVIFVDLLHWLLNTCDYGFDALLGVMSDAMKIECDNNAGQLPVFRTQTGDVIRQFKQVTSVTYLTTARRLTLMFYWVHVLGTEAFILPPRCRRPALVAIASIQTIILATHGRRAYSVQEWNRLVVDSAMEYFSALQSLMQYIEDNDTRANATPFTPFARGYRGHAEPESDSPGDGGYAPKLPGRGHIELSKKGIPHGIMHFVLQLRLAGHVYMHDTCAPEASHRYNIKLAIDRVRKGTEDETSSSMIDWQLNLATFTRIVSHVRAQPGAAPARRPRQLRTSVGRLTVHVNQSKLVKPTGTRTNRLHTGTCSPLRAGEDYLISNDVRVSYEELATLITSAKGWDPAYVRDVLHVRLYYAAHVIHPSGTKRSFCSTETHYQYNNGVRRDMVEIDLGRRRRGGLLVGRPRRGLAQLVSFMEFSHLPDGAPPLTSRSVLVRWLDKSSRTADRDEYDRPLCGYPLSNNHCLWEWSDAGRNRQSFRRRGFWNDVRRQRLWRHVDPSIRRDVVNSERRARYDILPYESILCHANVAVDPSTGHMLQTLQMI